MSLFYSTLKYGATALMGGLFFSATLLGLALLVLRLVGYQVFAVQSASMAPLFRKGDAVAVRVGPGAPLHPGQVITYRSTFNPRVLVSHRLVSINPLTRQAITRGDALKQNDSAISQSQILGPVTAVLPHLGSLLDAIRRPYVFAAVVYLPALVLMAAEAGRLAAAFTYTHYKVLD
jgi:sortase B